MRRLAKAVLGYSRTVVVLVALLANGRCACAASEPEVIETRGAFGDSKLAGPHRVYSTRGGWLEYGRFMEEPRAPWPAGISADWLAVKGGTDADLVLVASFADRRVRLYRIRLDGSHPLLVSVLYSPKGSLGIDPTLVENNGRFYATVTEITGLPNNADPEAPNGNYTIRLYQTIDLESWEHLGIIAMRNNNLEDGSLLIDPSTGQMDFFVESEIVDQRKSSIERFSSGDGGRTWIHADTLLPADADNEPASVIRTAADEILMLYSSDRENPGESYGAAEVYGLRYSLKDRKTLSHFKIPAGGKGILLLAAHLEGNGLSLLGIRSYLNDRTLLQIRTIIPKELLNSTEP
jgi:hypothetical protein